MAVDSNFDGVDHESLPAADLDFSCKSDADSTRPEAVVDIQHDGQWVRLPITKVETRINKDGPSDLTYTSRVDCPVTWGRRPNGDGKVQIYDYVGAAKKKEDPEFDVARVFYWNKYTEEYQVEQFGYVATIGPSAENGVFRFYIYDVADMMSNISVTKTYDSPDARQVTNFVAFDPEYGLEVNTPVPILGVSTTTPGEPVEIEGTVESFDKAVHGWLNENVPILKFGLSDDFEDLDEWIDDSLHTGGHKHFRRNRHTLVDVMNWLTDEIGGAWYFEPLETGVKLIVNNGTEESDGFAIARNSYYDGQVGPDEFDYTTGFRHLSADVVHNSSLEDLKPINYLELNGESADSFLGVNVDRTILGGPLGAPRGHTNKYPHIEVRYPPLLERSGGRKLGPPPIESGKTTLAEAEQEAVKRFLNAHEDSTDGSIEVRALPSIRPYDYFTAVPVCNDTFDASMNPIQYEVNTVVHSVRAEEPYITKLGVSIAINESAIEVTKELEEVNPNG